MSTGRARIVMSDSEVDDFFGPDVFGRDSKRDWTPEPVQEYEVVEKLMHENPEAFDFEANLQWAKEHALTEVQPWKTPTPHIEKWGLKPGWTIGTVESFFEAYEKTIWPKGTILHHDVRDKDERFDTNTFFSYDWWTFLNKPDIEPYHKYLKNRYLVLTKDVELLQCQGWADLYFKPFFGDNNWKPYLPNLWGSGDESEGTRPAEYRGNRALYELGYEGKWSNDEVELHLTQPLTCGVEVSANDLREYVASWTSNKRRRLSDFQLILL